MTLTRIAILCYLITTAIYAVGQDLDFERSRHKAMLDAIKTDVQKNYYDPAFKNIDIESKYREALQNIQAATTLTKLELAIAEFLSEFKDSHVYFIPPPKVNSVDYGFSIQMVGDKCRVNWVKKGSDAERKGVEIGDEIKLISGFVPTRTTISMIRSYLFELFPEPTITLDLKKPDGAEV